MSVAEDIKSAEEKVLIRALRDSNIPKIIDDDLEVFMGLIGDLFPGIDIPRLVNEPFEQTISKCAREANLQAEKSFILKIVQLEELLIIRHSVFILGNAGTGKSQCWKMLAKTYQAMGRKILTPSLNPKAVTTKELYGYINQQTREWHDGLFSIIMRDMSNIQNTEPKWIILDGDIDPCVAHGELISDIHCIGKKVQDVAISDVVLVADEQDLIKENRLRAKEGQCMIDLPENHNKDINVCKVKNSKLTGLNKMVYCITTESGRSLRVTRNHRIVVIRNGSQSYVRVDELVPGDRVLEGPIVDETYSEWDKEFVEHMDRNTVMAIARVSELIANKGRVLPIVDLYFRDSVVNDLKLIKRDLDLVTYSIVNNEIHLDAEFIQYLVSNKYLTNDLQLGPIFDAELPRPILRELIATYLGLHGGLFKVGNDIRIKDLSLPWLEQLGLSIQTMEDCVKLTETIGIRYNKAEIVKSFQLSSLYKQQRFLASVRKAFANSEDAVEIFNYNLKYMNYYHGLYERDELVNFDLIAEYEKIKHKPLVPCRIISLNPLDNSTVYDLSTYSLSFLASGILVHNCWIESLNTVMDDNKTLTLASNERIPLNESMRLIFEIGDLKYATPATVSRAGIIYINSNDVGYTAFFLSWLDKREMLVNNEKIILQSLYEKYVTPSMEWVPRHFKSICPIQPITYIETLCRILDAVLIHANFAAAIESATASGTNTLVKDVYETYFVFATIWSFGGPLFKDQLVDYRSQFNQWFRGEFKPSIPLGNVPNKEEAPKSARGNRGTQSTAVYNSVFDYLVKINEDGTPSWVPWDTIVTRYSPKTSVENNISDILVNTVQTTQIHYMLDILLKNGHPALLAGFAGSGKSVLMTRKLRDLAESVGGTTTYMYQTINLNYYTTTAQLQMILESNLEKKSGRTFAPPANKTIIVHIDDLNMAQVDSYGTQAPITLLRQHKDYGAWYDREKMTLKLVTNMQHVACMNPSAGSFTINPRYQRHFSVFAVDYPSTDILKAIYGNILGGYFNNSNGSGMVFNSLIVQAIPKVVESLLLLHEKVQSNFLPTAIKFHYQFNLRDLSNICEGIMRAIPGDVGEPNTDSFKHLYNSPIQLVRLYSHEACRVYRDRLTVEEDIQQFDRLLSENIKTNLTSINGITSAQEETLLKEPNIYSAFSQGFSNNEERYAEIEDYPRLKGLLEEALETYNEENAKMDLVLFEDAMEHVNRINRIITSDGYGNALLIGVGGSGKQSLAKLAANIAGYEVFQITISSTYGVSDFKLDLQQLYIKAGVKSTKVLFIFTDSQIVDEEFLVYINDLLSSGNIIGLFAPDEEENIINGLRNEVKASGLIDTKENCWSYFINKVRKNLHVVLGFSPVGDALRVRARKFPALVNCCTIDWFHSWPHEALHSVANRFINRLNTEMTESSEKKLFESDELINNISRFMADTTSSVDAASREYLVVERKHNYTTPKSFLELISLYSKLLVQGNEKITTQIDRLEAGNIKLAQTEKDVSILKEELDKQKILVEERKKAADELLDQVGKDTNIVEERRKEASIEAEKCAEIKRDVEAQAAECQKELDKAEPAVIAAEAALNTLNKSNLVELKSFGKPSDDVVNVMKAVIWLLSNPASPPRDFSWNAAKKLMGDVQKFLKTLVEYDKNSIDPNILKNVKPIVEHPQFNGGFIKAKSVAAAGICEWARNVVIYHEIYKEVVPKREKLAEANRNLEAAQAKLNAVENNLAQLDKKLQQLTKKFEEATEEKNRVIEQAEKTQGRLNLANRLVNGLGSEKVRWKESVAKLEKDRSTLVGDMLLAAAFISYIGAFSRQFRQKLLTQWRERIAELGIPICSDPDPLSLLTDSATIAQWNNDKLPTDRISLENAAIVCNCERWPLIIDPQLQGIVWLKQQYASAGKELKILRMGQPKWLDAIETAVQNGEAVLIEGLGETIDAVLNPLLGRNTIKKGQTLYVKLGDKEVEFDKNFRLYLQTKLANPHYSPEIQAQTTLINFTVTEDGLEDQLLGLVVNEERPDLEAQKSALMRQQNEFMIRLKELEAGLLQKLSTAEGDILADIELIENLETTKRTATEIETQVAEAKVTETNINTARERYRPVAARASMLFFLLDSLSIIDRFYLFSLKAFTTVFFKAIRRSREPEPEEPTDADPNDILNKRIDAIIEKLTFDTYCYASRGLFERHKLIFVSQLTFKILQRRGELPSGEFDYLLRCPKKAGANPLKEWLPDNAWQCVLALASIPGFETLPDDVEGSAKRWREWMETEQPEKAKMPQDWKNKTPLQQLCVMRALRPDRMQNAMSIFVAEIVGHKYTEAVPYDLELVFSEAEQIEPLLFILSPGVDPLKDVEALGKKLGFTADNGKFRHVSLGQGQDPIAEQFLADMAKTGGWVMLENLHLMRSWLPKLEKLMETYCGHSTEEFRLFLTAEPSADPSVQNVTPGILEASVKITNEPPQGIKANMMRALNLFNQDTFEMCSKPNEFRSILFALVFFHAVILERRKFGPIGWNIPYNFNNGDLVISKDVLFNYLESNQKIPWDDLKYMFCDILYGGHITDDWDRRYCRTFLETLMTEDLFEDKLLGPDFPAPPPSSLEEYKQYVQEYLPPENPKLFGLHPNAEINFLTVQSNVLLHTVYELQPRNVSTTSGVSREDRIKDTLDDILDQLPENFDMQEIFDRIEERTPYVTVCLQECQQMNILLTIMRQSLIDVSLGLKGELTISEAMEAIMDSLYLGVVPDAWAKVSYPSLKPLSLWFVDLQRRVKQLAEWQGDLNLPPTVWLSGLFNPQSFLRAVLQTAARANQWPLDKMFLNVEVSKKNVEDITVAPRDGAYIYGLAMEGARWDKKGGCIRDALMKELYSELPPVFLKAVPLDKMDVRDTYVCPVYMTSKRGPTYVWSFNLKTRDPPSKWILAGVALLLATD